MMSYRSIKSKGFLVLLAALTGTVHAEWTGPGIILSGSWGSGPTEFYVDWGDTPAYAEYPRLMDVSSSGVIVVSDELNGRIKVYASNGDLTSNIAPPIDNPASWGMRPRFVGQNVMIPLPSYYFYSINGELLNEIPAPSGDEHVIGERLGRLYVATKDKEKNQKKWLTYSPDGMLLGTSTEKPLELGHLQEVETFFYQGEKKRRVRISFPGQQWIIISQYGACREYSYQRDSSGNLYCVGSDNIERYNACGKVVSEFSLPKGVYTVEEATDPRFENHETLVEEYDHIVMDDEGNVYSGRITQAGYSVVKWTWQSSPNDSAGAPDSPMELTATSFEGMAALNWIRSLQDPGCVTEYEIGRATTPAGPYTTIATVPVVDTYEPYIYTDDSVQAGTTYYYAVRAVSAIANSDYSNEASVLVE